MPEYSDHAIKLHSKWVSNPFCRRNGGHAISDFIGAAVERWNGDYYGIFCADSDVSGISHRVDRSYETDSDTGSLLYAKSAFTLEAFGYEEHGGSDSTLFRRKTVFLFQMVSETLCSGNFV